MRVIVCTGCYIGKDVSADGKTIVGRSCDLSHDKNTITNIVCSPRIENKPGRKIQAIESKIQYEYPATTYKCVNSPIAPVTDYGTLTSIGLNEYGLVVSGTVTAYNCKEIQDIDPFLPDGICEETLPDYIGKTCKDPKEAIDFIEKTMAEKGNYSANSLIVANQEEAWLIELYSGHQWAAIKLPTDKVCVYGNMFMIQTEYVMDDPSQFRYSKDLFEMPKKAGIAVETDGKMNLTETYGGKGRIEDYSNIRTHMGHYFLAKSTSIEYKTSNRYPLFFDPDKKVGLKDVFELYRYRYEGTQYCPEDNGRDDIRLIGTESQFNVHVLQIDHDAKPEMSSVAWIALGNCEHSIFLPYSNLISEVDKRYDHFDELSKNLKAGKYLNDKEGRPILYNENIAQVCYKRLSLIAEHDRKIYGKGVRDF